MLRWSKIGFAVMFVTGGLLFMCHAGRAYESPFFRAKVIFLVLLGINAAVYQVVFYPQMAQWARRQHAVRCEGLRGVVTAHVDWRDRVRPHHGLSILMSVIVFIRDSQYGMPIAQSVHLVGLTLLLATVLVLNLRLAGVAMKDSPLDWLARQLRPWMLGGLALVVLSGVLIFVGTPAKYLASNPFRVKMVVAWAGDAVPVRRAPPGRRRRTPRRAREPSRSSPPPCH